MARPRKKTDDENMDDYSFDVIFEFSPGQKVLTKFDEIGYISSCQVNVKGIFMYYVETGIDKGGWLYSDDFKPVFE